MSVSVAFPGRLCNAKTHELTLFPSSCFPRFLLRSHFSFLAYYPSHIHTYSHAGLHISETESNTDPQWMTLVRILCTPSCVFQVFTRYGKCYTFNAGDDGRPPLITTKGGMGNGLELMLDIQQDEYLPVWGETGEGRSSVIFDCLSHCEQQCMCTEFECVPSFSKGPL